MTVTENDLLDAMREAWGRYTNQGSTDRGEALSRRDIEKLTGWHHNKVAMAIRAMVEAGLWECIRIPRLQVNGSMRRIEHYRPVKD